MKKTDKLKVVFDFIADYLNEDNEKPKKVKKNKKKKGKKLTTKKLTTKELITEGDVITKDENNLKRAYEIMKKIEEYESRGKFIGRDNILKAITDGSARDENMFAFKETANKLKKLKDEFGNEKSTQLKRILESSKN